MNKFLVGGAVAALMVAMGPAVAQTPPPPGVAQGTAAAPAPMPRVHMEVMTDRVMTRAEVSEHVGKMFTRLDTNRDGFVTKEELNATRDKFMAMHGDVEKRLAEHGVMMGNRGEIFDRLDTNKDGNISRQEFMAGRPERREERVIVMRDGAPGEHGHDGPGMMRMRMPGPGMGMGMGGHLLEMADANKDGRVSLAEAQTAALAHFDRADLNHDGKITPDERQQMRQQRRMEHRQG